MHRVIHKYDIAMRNALFYITLEDKKLTIVLSIFYQKRGWEKKGIALFLPSFKLSSSRFPNKYTHIYFVNFVQLNSIRIIENETKQIEIRLDIPCRIYKVERTKLSKQSGSCCSIVETTRTHDSLVIYAIYKSTCFIRFRLYANSWIILYVTSFHRVAGPWREQQDFAACFPRRSMGSPARWGIKPAIITRSLAVHRRNVFMAASSRPININPILRVYRVQSATGAINRPRFP